MNNRRKRENLLFFSVLKKRVLGQKQKKIFEEKLEISDLPQEKKERTTTKKLNSIVSEIDKYLSKYKIEKITKKKSNKNAIKDYNKQDSKDKKVLD